MHRLFFWIRFLSVFIFFNAVILSICLIYILWKFSPELPSYDNIKNYKPNLSSRVYTSDGMLLEKFYIQERIFIPINRIPKDLINAFLAAEDKKFYSHYGIDIIAIFRATFTNIINFFSSKKLIGASTITQQVVKNLLLSSDVSFERKIKEIILAIRIENILSKDQILELYLNDIYLGYGSYGVGSASLNYFNKSINELQIHEIAFLAALPKAPNNYNPKINYDEALARRNWVINKMYQNDFISEIKLHSKKLPIIIKERYESNFTSAKYFNEEIRKYLYKEYGKEKLYSDGLIIKTTIDTDLQAIAEKVLFDGLIKYDRRQGWRGVIDNLDFPISSKDFNNKMFNNPFPKKWNIVQINNIANNILFASDKNEKKFKIDLSIDENLWLKNKKFQLGDLIFIEKKNKLNLIHQLPEVNGAIVVLNPHNGDILALTGGISFELSEFNRATQAKRQPGSAFKPFVYITALKEGYNPSTLVLDAPYVVDQGPGLPKWKPANYTEEFYGLNTMRTGIEKSRNLMTIRLADKIGMKKILLTAKDFKINEYIDNKLSMALGSGLVRLIDITNAYGMIANGGKEIYPNMIKSIYSKEGKKILHNEIKHCINCKLKTIDIKNSPLPEIKIQQKEVLDNKIAYQIVSMLEGVVIRGTGRKLSELNIPIAGKTGTTNDNKDAWFIGFTPDLVIGVYVGHDKPKSLGFKQTGSSVAVPIFKSFIKEADINNSRVPFRIPSGLSFVKIDPKTGLQSNKEDSILEPFILGNEPFNMNSLNILDALGTINNDSISGTGSLLEN
ncbi:MAG: penicillin-binding protein [Rickettsiales bacterium]|nr:penicillin-binding protein [Rickettsiales bacterium]